MHHNGVSYELRAHVKVTHFGETKTINLLSTLKDVRGEAKCKRTVEVRTC